MTNFEELDAWKYAREFRKAISKLSKKFPIEEKYRLTDQILRSSRSVTANIAEGFGRYHYQENIQFCRQVRGSLDETVNHLICAYDEELISDQSLTYHKDMANHCLKVLNGYVAYLKRAKKGE